MKKILILLIIISIFVPCISANAASDFSDVPDNHYSNNAIQKVKDSGIINGYPDGSYRPDKPVTRAEMAVLMCRMANEEPSEAKSIFTDIPHNYWADGYIAKANEINIITGDGKGIFRPEDFVTYEEAIKMTVMATGRAKAVGTYPGKWSESYLDIARICKITDNLLTAPGENVTRADVAVMISNALKIRDNPQNILFAKHIYNDRQNIPTNVAFCLDLSTFSGDNRVYNKELAKASAMLSMTAYDKINIDAKTPGNADRALKLMGFNNVKTINLKEGYSDNHVTTIYLGKRTLISDEKETNIISVVLKGTDGSREEWSSNFDIGSGVDNSSYTKENHKGYDITAQRAIKEIKKYIAENTDGKSENVLWITGHSRGASVANLCGAYLADEGETCFVYGFAASMSTTRRDCHKYDFIFNIINTDDIVTYMPLSSWGFKHFGKTASVSLGHEFLSQWQKSTGLTKYKFKDNIAQLVSKMSDFSPSRKACYEYVAEGVTVGGANTLKEAEAYAKNRMSLFPRESIPYLKYDIIKSPKGSDNPYIVEFKFQPAFYLQAIGCAMSDVKSIPSLITIPIPNSMESAYTAALSSYSGGIVHPHTPETYYVIANSISGDDFN